MINPDAGFDCLSIALRLQQSLSNVAPGELHLFAYLACLLSLYRGNAVSDWGYGFAGTRNGSPFSPEIGSAQQRLVSLGLLSYKKDYLTISEVGREEYKELRRLSQNALREPYVEAACSSVLALPVGLIRTALSEEPMLRPSAQLASTRPLLAGPGLVLLHEQFEILSAAVGVEVRDLLIPAAVWLTYLSRVAEQRQAS